MIKTILKLIAFLIIVVLAWQFFNSPPNTRSVCYTWAKATDPISQLDENGIDGAKWLQDHIKSEKDLVNIDSDVLNAINLYQEGEILEDVDPYERLGLRQNVIDACEKIEPGSTKH